MLQVKQLLEVVPLQVSHAKLHWTHIPATLTNPGKQVKQPVFVVFSQVRQELWQQVLFGLCSKGAMHESQFVLKVPLQVAHSKLQQRLFASLLDTSQEPHSDSRGPVHVKQLGEQQ